MCAHRGTVGRPHTLSNSRPAHIRNVSVHFFRLHVPRYMLCARYDSGLFQLTSIRVQRSRRSGPSRSVYAMCSQQTCWSPATG